MKNKITETVYTGSEPEYILERCINCKYYDSSPFPEYGGMLAVCRSNHPVEHGAGKIGQFTLAHSTCFERKDR